MENTFNLKKFLAEGKLLKEEENLDKAYSSNQLKDIIEDNKATLAKQFDLENPSISYGDEGEPVMVNDDMGNQVDFIKKEDWEDNKGFYKNNEDMGEISLDGIDIIYVKNPF